MGVLAGQETTGSGKQPPALDPETYNCLRAVTDDDWKLIILRLTAYAINKFKRLSWRCALPLGQEPKDVVQEAIKEVWGGGNRSWSVKSQPDLLTHLKNVVDSIVSNLVRHKDHTARYVPSSENAEDPIASVPATDATSPEQEATKEELATQLWEKLDGSPELEEVYLLMVDEYRPEEIAQKLGLPQKDVYNRIRRIRRKLEEFRR